MAANVGEQVGLVKGFAASGKVASQQLSDAIGGTSANTNSVQTLDTTFGDPDVESLRQKLNELINALKR